MGSLRTLQNRREDDSVSGIEEAVNWVSPEFILDLHKYVMNEMTDGKRIHLSINEEYGGFNLSATKPKTIITKADVQTKLYPKDLQKLAEGLVEGDKLHISRSQGELYVRLSKKGN